MQTSDAIGAAASQLGADAQSPIVTLNKDRPGWVHVWVGGSATCYHIDPGRRADALEGVIGADWSGLLHRDGSATYNRFREATHQHCVAHILRRARELLAGAVGGAVHFPRQVITWFTDAIDVRKRYARGEIGLSVMADPREVFASRLMNVILPERRLAPYTRLSNHLCNHFEEWFTFLRAPLAETTNNRAEGPCVRGWSTARCGAATARGSERQRSRF